MNKCDFCTKSGPDKKCSWDLQALREYDCNKAISRMIKAFGGKDEVKRRNKL